MATSLLPSSNISAIITMSTPHTLPPARFDSRIDTLYDRLQLTLLQDSTPILSICGGVTDMLIPSESCILPEASNNTFRRTVFTSALEGAWTGVGHREMVWCHQVRWRIARAALELGEANSLPSRATVLDKWLRDGHSLPPNALKTEYYTLDISDAAILAPGKNLLLKSPHISNTYLLPVKRDSTSSASQKITVLVSQGSIFSVAPQNPLRLQVSIFTCTTSSTPYSSLRCVTLTPDILKLIPNPIFGRVFPVPSEGSDESEGTVLYESHVPYIETEEQWIGVKVDGAEGQGWIAAGLSIDRRVVSSISTLCMRLLLTCKKVRKLTLASSPADGQTCNNQCATERNFEHIIYVSESTIKCSCSISCVPFAIFDAVLLRFVGRHCQCLAYYSPCCNRCTYGTLTYAHISVNGNTLLPSGERSKSSNSFAHPR